MKIIILVTLLFLLNGCATSNIVQNCDTQYPKLNTLYVLNDAVVMTYEDFEALTSFITRLRKCVDKE
ncbi:MAG: hypothetical protein HRU25_11885 [Psychrobium sp.]|nr:hypothetical protein [Psychrobium sp.]